MVVKSKSFGFLFTGLLVLCLFNPHLEAQDTQPSTFSGKVLDAFTGKPIPGASVYIAGSTAGGSTDDSGHYSFSTELTGNHYIVFSLVGYKTKPRPITLTAGGSHVINAKLEPVTIQLQEIEVISSNKEWKRHYKYFQKQFLGTTEFAKATKIINPWVLDFEQDGNLLKAFNNQPLMVSNRALGYQIKIELLQFEWNTQTGRGIYQTLSLYQELDPNSHQQKEQWQKNRIETFLGSQAHFFRCLYRGDWKENNYLLGYEDDIEQLTEEDLKYYFLTAASPFYGIPDGWKAYRLKEYLTVKYQKYLTAKDGSNKRQVKLQKTAGIQSSREDKIFFINKWGLLRDVASVYQHGLWKRNRIANSLPNNFTIQAPEYTSRRSN